MVTKTWVAGEDINAVDVNSYLQNQMVLQFANATERASEIPNPTVGMVSFLSGTGAFEVFTDKTTPPSWRPPWNTAWGLVRGAMVYDIPLNTGAQWIIMHLPTRIPGRQYKVEYDVTLTPANMGNFDIKYQIETGYDLQSYLTNYQSWTQRLLLHQIFAGAVTNDTGVIGLVLADAVTGAMGWGRVRVLDVGPV
jgi:hypothetical protein